MGWGCFQELHVVEDYVTFWSINIRFYQELTSQNCQAHPAVTYILIYQIVEQYYDNKVQMYHDFSPKQ